MDNDKPSMNPYLAIFTAVLAVSTSAIIVKLSTAPASVIAFYRLAITVLIMSPWIISNHLGAFKKITRSEFFYSAIAGIFLAFHFIFWFKSLDFTTVASSVVLVTLQPLFAFIGTMIFFKEKYTTLSIIGGIISIVGSFIISWGDFALSQTAFFGDVLALIACGMITAYLLIGQRIRQSLHLIVYTYTVYSVASVVLLIYIFIAHESLGPYPVTDWLYFSLLAVFPTLLGHSILNWAVKWVSTSVISMSILGEPIGASLLAYFILKEIPVPSQLIGGGIILLGIALFLQGKRKKQVNVGKSR